MDKWQHTRFGGFVGSLCFPCRHLLALVRVCSHPTEHDQSTYVMPVGAVWTWELFFRKY